MNSIVHSIGRVLIPDGTYTGTYSGYVVSVKLKAENSVHPSHTITREFNTREGIRGIVKCKVIVTNESAIVEV